MLTETKLIDMPNLSLHHLATVPLITTALRQFLFPKFSDFSVFLTSKTVVHALTLKTSFTASLLHDTILPFKMLKTYILYETAYVNHTRIMIHLYAATDILC